jgi:uncharacterized protein (TIGR03437 family)
MTSIEPASLNPSTFFTKYAAGLLAILSFAFCAAPARAAVLLTASPASVALSCNTLTGTGPAATIVVKPAAPLTNSAISVILGVSGAGVVVTAPSPAILNAANQSLGLTYTVNLAAGCSGVTSSAATLRFFANGVADVAVPASLAVVAQASALVASPIEVTCIRSAGPPPAYTPGPLQSALLTSAAQGGTPFTVDTSTIPAWLALPPTTAGSAGATGVTLVMSPLAPCGNYAAGSSNSISIHLKNPPAPDGLIPVTLKILSPSSLVATPAAPALAYTKGSGTPSYVDVTLSAPAAAPFVIDPASLPSWLSADAPGGATPKTLRFSTTSVADAGAPGAYSATVRFQVAGFGDLSVPFRLTVGNPQPKLTVAEGLSRNFSWIVGQPLPTPYITIASSATPIAYSIATGGDLAPIIGSAFLKGYAYSYATPIPVTFDAHGFSAARPGTVLTGTVSITWGTPATTTVISLSITLQAGAATVLAVAPPNLPTASPGQTFVVALTGNGFLSASDLTQPTTVGIVSGGILVSDVNLAATVLNSSNIVVTLTVPAAADPLLPFAAAGAGGTVTLGVCNPSGSACSVPTGTAKLLLTPYPVIQAVTSAASFLQTAPPALPLVAPYDMVSLFGASFCISGGTGCRDGQVLYGTPDPATLRYPLSLSPDVPGSAQRLLTVVFQTHATPPVAIATAPLLFATNGQINLLVPSVVSSYVGKSIDVVVNFGTPVASAVLSSAPFPVRVAAADPALFTIGTDGQGDGAILGQDWSIIGSGNEAAMRAVPADSDIVQIYMTGLGAPDSAANNSAAGGGQSPADCVTPASYLAALNQQMGAALTTLDGVLLAGSLLNAGRLPPCLSSAAAIPSVTIGGQPATVTYAGWVTDSVAGQYQVNVRLPGSAAGRFVSVTGEQLPAPITAAVQLPVVVAARGIASQPGVTIWVAPRLKVTAPSALQGAAGAAWPASGSVVKATDGTPAYRYAITNGTLPAGLSLDPATGAISGTPALSSQGTYAITVSATDSAPSPINGSTTFTLLVN